mgnify:CR=1 FL=1
MELDSIIKNCKAKQKKILDERWERKYKGCCPKYYMSLEEMTKDLDEYNYLYTTSDPNFVSKWVYSNYFNSNSLPLILHFLKEQNLSLPRKVILMTCESCACRKCENRKEHLMGCLCEECAKDHFTRYQKYCVKQRKDSSMKIENKTDNKYLNLLVKDTVHDTPYENSNIIIKDYDLDRVYLDINGEEFDIRTWNISEIGNSKIEIIYTLFKIEENRGVSIKEDKVVIECVG